MPTLPTFATSGVPSGGPAAALASAFRSRLISGVLRPNAQVRVVRVGEVLDVDIALAAQQFCVLLHLCGS